MSTRRRTTDGRVLITGATGEIGRPLSQRLIESGDELVVLSRDPDHARQVVPGAADYMAWTASELGGGPQRSTARRA